MDSSMPDVLGVIPIVGRGVSLLKMSMGVPFYIWMKLKTLTLLTTSTVFSSAPLSNRML